MGIKSVRKSRFGNINQADALFYKVFLCFGILDVTVSFLEVNSVFIWFLLNASETHIQL